MNKLILGDNLEILKTLTSESVDLVYLDPPFFSNQNYEVIWGDKGEVRSFENCFSGGIDHYIVWLKERVVEMYRILKPTGSIFLHCDWHADAYIRAEILDKIFGYQNFRSHIVWKRTTARRNIKQSLKKLDVNFDTIYFYAKSDQTIYTPFSEEQTEMSFWEDIKPMSPTSTERIGYPTQKPMALLERIIKCASKEGDIILDPFVGGGTTVAVADKYNRRWIGIDQSVQAIKVTEFRMNLQQDLFSKPFIVQLHKYDYNTLRYKNAFEFKTFIIQQFGGIANTKQRGDLGLDGKTKDNTPIQVKRSENIGRNVIDNFLSAVQRFDSMLFDKNNAEQKPVGHIIAFSFGRGATKEVARLKNQKNIIINLEKVEDIVPITKKPNIIIDKVGEQIYKFKAGLHNIAVKVVDNDDLENLEIIKLKINGQVERT